MWTGGKAPELPASPERPAVMPSSFYVPSRDAELDELRQRGLAKILNRHFSDQIKKLAAEKAAADAALRDLERRKEQTGEFEPSGDGEISPLDALYLSANQWKNECRRKERETILLYQRYVDRFGASGHVEIPDAAAVGLMQSLREEEQRQQLRQRSASSSPAGTESTASAVSGAVSPSVSARLAAPPPQMPPSMPATGGAAVPIVSPDVIDQALEEYLCKARLATLGKDDDDQQTPKEDAEFRERYRRQFEELLADAASNEEKKGGKKKKQQADEAAGPSASFLCGGRLTGTDELWDGAGGDDDDDYEDEDEDGLAPLCRRPRMVDQSDSESVVSGLTSVNSAVTREVMMEAERNVVEFLTEEREAIRKMMDEESSSSSSGSDPPTLNSELGTVQQQAADQAENMVKQMQDILHDFNINADKQTSHKEPRRFQTSNPSEKWMIYYDETYQREYYHEVNSNRTQWHPPVDNDDSATTSTDDPSLLLSSAELKPESGIMTGQSQLDEGGVGSGGRGMSRIAQYRRKRRLRRRRRLVVGAVLVLSSAAGVVYYLSNHPEAARTVLEHQAVKAALPYVEEWVDLKQVESWFPTQTQTEKTTVPSKANEKKAIKTKLKKAESPKVPKVIKPPVKPIPEPLVEDLKQKYFEKMKQEEAMKVLQKRAEKPKEIPKEKEGAREVDGKSIRVSGFVETGGKGQVALVGKGEAKAGDGGGGGDRLASALELRDQERGIEQANRTRRPWFCNIPLIYIFHRRCRRLARESPIFDLFGVVSSMMQ